MTTCPALSQTKPRARALRNARSAKWNKHSAGWAATGRLRKDFEHQLRSSEARVYLASIHRVLRLLDGYMPISKLSLRVLRMVKECLHPR